MTNYDSVRLAAERTMASSYTTTPICYDNTPAPTGEFVRVIDEPGSVSTGLNGGGDINLSVGKNATQRNRGALVFEINTPKNVGRSRANGIAEELSQLFTKKRIDDVDFHNSETVRTGELDNHFQLSLFVYYRRDSR